MDGVEGPMEGERTGVANAGRALSQWRHQQKTVNTVRGVTVKGRQRDEKSESYRRKSVSRSLISVCTFLIQT